MICPCRIVAICTWWFVISIFILSHHKLVWNHLGVPHHTFLMLFLGGLAYLARLCQILARASGVSQLGQGASYLLFELQSLRSRPMNLAFEDRDSIVVIKSDKIFVTEKEALDISVGCQK